jgi:putative ABC transport system substrate-binding protein
MPVIGFLSSRSPGESAAVVAAFRNGLGEAGFTEGRNVVIAFRWAEGRYDELPALAAELVGLRVAVLFAAGGPPAALAAKGATQTIPVVFSAASDPVAIGLVQSLNRPGGNVTGMSTLTSPLAAKRIELLKELAPTAAIIAYLVNPSNPSVVLESREAQEAADALKIRLHLLKATSASEIDDAFAEAALLRVDGLMVSGEPYFDSQRERIVALASRQRLITSYAWRENVAAGGLMSYGHSLTDSYRQAGIYAGRVLKGEKPAELPVMQPSKFELVLNLKAAKGLGLEVPPRLLERADEVIE